VGEWAKVVVNPLGLAGFALFLIFLSLLRMTRKRAGQRWLVTVFIVSALVCLFGGLGLSYKEISRSSNASEQKSRPEPQLRQDTKQVQQNTTGAGSPAVQGVQGDVNLTIDQSSGKSQPQKEPGKK
jgi:hypothetical protein